MINENNQSKDIIKKKYVKKLFVNNLNRSSMSIYSHGSNKQSEVSYGSLNQRKKISKSLVNNVYNDNGRRKSNFIKNQNNNKENVFKSSNMLKRKSTKVSEILDTNDTNKIMKKSMLSSFLTTQNNPISTPVIKS